MLELMFAILIISILASLALPTVQALIARNELTAATDSVSDALHFAQVHAAMRGRAYGVIVTTSDNHTDGQGLIEVVEGTSNLCSSISDLNAKTMRSLDVEDEYETIHIGSVQPADLENVGICFQPDGRVVRADNSQPVASTNTQLAAGSVVIQLQQLMPLSGGNTALNPPAHDVVIEYNGDVHFRF